MIWGTLDHERILNNDLRADLLHHLLHQSRKNGIGVEEINVRPEHVHILCTLPVEQTVAQLAKTLKGESSRWINENNMITGKFRWQRGYSAFSVSASQFGIVKKYIENQEQHHRRKSFSVEYQEWAKQYGVGVG